MSLPEGWDIVDAEYIDNLMSYRTVSQTYISDFTCRIRPQNGDYTGCLGFIGHKGNHLCCPNELFKNELFKRITKDRWDEVKL